jgi:dienelactone hydrolase
MTEVLASAHDFPMGSSSGSEGRVMKGIPLFVRFAMVASLATVGVACGGGADDDLTVSSQVVSDPTTPELRVLAPDGEGPWPVVVALHGFGGTGQDMVELGTRLAKAGVVVFVPTYNTDLSTPAGLTRASDDLGCAYHVARRVAPEYGGDLSQPVTAVGWSLGADLGVLGVLGPPTDNSTSRCAGELPSPDVVVALSGCYYEFEGNPITWFDDLTGWTNKTADVHLVAGDNDTTCPASQTERLATSLRTEGYDVDVTQLRSANHGAPIFHDERDGQWEVITDDPAGEHAVQIILDAVTTAGGTTSG